MNNTSSTNGSVPIFCTDGYLSKPSQHILMSLHALCCAVAVVGNGLVIVAVTRTRALRKVSMFFVASLSSADFLLGINMNVLYTIYLAVYDIDFNDLPVDFFEVYMKVENYFWIQTVTATTFSLCAVSIDRFIAVVRPLHYQQFMTERRCRCAIGFVWLFSFILPIVRFFIDDFWHRRYMWLACSIVTIAIPFLVVVICYAQIARVTRRQVRAIRETSVDSRQATYQKDVVSNRKTAVTAIIVGGMFFFSFFPVVVVFAMLLLVQDECLDLKLNKAWAWVALLSFAHSAFNPWVYCYRSRQFRKAFKQILCQ